MSRHAEGDVVDGGTFPGCAKGLPVPGMGEASGWIGAGRWP